MLVVTRKTNAKVLIGNDITVQIVSVKGASVRLGIEAPDNVRILREEVKERIDRDRETRVEGTACQRTRNQMCKTGKELSDMFDGFSLAILPG